jgi:carboxylesterase
MKKITKYSWMVLAVILLLAACSKTPDIDNNYMLDGDKIFDPSLYDSAKYLVSVRIDNPTTKDIQTPVVIAVHGYSATTYEWDEFRDFVDNMGNVYVSQVLLGGHGRTYDDFKNSSWKDWQASILDEYHALKAKGYAKISFAGSSAACPLMLDLIKRGEIGYNGLEHIFLIDPIVIPSDKLMSIVGLVGPMLGYLETDMTSEEEGHWYHFRPQETLQELLDLNEKIRKDLQNGFKLPQGTNLKVYKSIHDPTADAVSAVLINKGLTNYDGRKVSIQMLESDLHVVTRLKGRDDVTSHDRDIQKEVFNDMYRILTK